MSRLPMILLCGVMQATAGAASARALPQQPPTRGKAVQPKAPPRGAAPGRPASRDSRTVRVGTAQLSGRVAAADTGAPLRQAEIVLSSSALGAQRRTVSDAAGRYRFTDLPSGRYWVRAARPGFVTLRYGATDPLESGRYVDVSDGGAISDTDFKLPRAAVISGQVVDESGEPVLDAEVRAMRYQNNAGQRRLVVASRIRMTDDLGAFRIFGLLPGTYYVSATPRWRDPVTDENQETESSYAPTYYPGTMDLAQARAVTVALGSEVSGITFGLTPVRVVRMRGTVLDSAGNSVGGARVTAVRREAGNAFVTAAETNSRTDGTFELPNLTPGAYNVQAWMRGSADTPAEFGALPVQIGGGDTEGLVIRTAAGGTLRGHITLRTEAGQAAFKPTLLEITARPAAQDVRVPVGQSSRTRARDDWSFELRGLSGPRLLRISGLPAPWALDSIRLNGSDVTDEPLDPKAGSVTSGLEIVLTTRTTEIEGTLEPSQRDQQAVSIVVFPPDRSHWDAADRRVQIRRAAPDGRFGIRGLPPGDYLAIAVPFMWQGEWTDPAFLERASASATRFTLGPAERKTVRLKLTPLGQ